MEWKGEDRRMWGHRMIEKKMAAVTENKSVLNGEIEKSEE